jgi:transposase InsO family protein
MAIRNRRPAAGGIVHADHGTQFTSWVFGEKIRAAGLLPSFGTIGDGLDNAMTESFWSSMQIELLDRQKWKTRVRHPHRRQLATTSGTQRVGQVKLITRSLDPTGVGRARWTMRWKPALNAFAITFGDRFPATETY